MKEAELAATFFGNNIFDYISDDWYWSQARVSVIFRIPAAPAAAAAAAAAAGGVGGGGGGGGGSVVVGGGDGDNEPGELVVMNG